MDLKDMTLEQLQSLRTEKYAALQALKATSVKTLATAEQGEALAAELREVIAAIDALNSFASGEDEFAPKEPEAEKAPEAPADETAARPENDGEIKDGDPVTPGQTDPSKHEVDPDQVKPGEVVNADGEGVPVAESKAPEASGGVEALAAKRAAAKADETPVGAPYRRGATISLVASAGLDNYAGGQQLDSLTDVARGAIDRVNSFPGWSEPTGQMREYGEQGIPMIQKFGTAQINLGFPEELMVDERRMTPEQIDDVLARAGDESTLPGGSLVAAGGWCAPSETDYGMSVDATREGLLSAPEVAIRRGGLKWPIQPQFSDFYATPGFKYTEAQVISGVTKPCVTIPCPTFDEARLNVEGLCVKVDILTNVGYPEVVRNYTEGTLLAHDHWMNATKIAAIETIAGTARDFTALDKGSVVDDSLAAFELVAEQTRQKYRLGFNQTLEAVLPHWIIKAWKADLRRRNGLLAEPVTDQQVIALLRGSGINPQFVYDWQDLPLVDDSGTAGFNELLNYPATYNALLYPAGALIFGTAPVINLSTVYDAASLAANQYTGLFTEQGWLVAKRKFEVVNVKLDSGAGNLAGRRGSLNVA